MHRCRPGHAYIWNVPILSISVLKVIGHLGCRRTPTYPVRVVLIEGLLYSNVLLQHSSIDGLRSALLSIIRTLTMFMRVVALRCQHVDNEVP